MRKSNGQKGNLSTQEQLNKNKEDASDAKMLVDLKDNLRLNTTGTDDDLAVDIQDAIGREASLSLVADNILVTVEGEVVTLGGEVYREEEKMTAGDLAVAFAGEDNVNNYLRVINNFN
jgi:osmotically-inducible protein OsmY